MEVHHHAHSPADPGPSTSSGHRALRKKWTHYLWEFLMLFLAVFCGFLAENMREHYVENKKAKEYAQSLAFDLLSDNETVERFTGNTITLISYLDSLADIIGEDRIKQVKGGQVYYYGRFCNGGLQILWHNATLDQIKNSGGLRYFKNISMVKKISEYYAKTKEIDSKYETDLTRIVKATELRNEVFRSNFLKPYTRIYFTISNSSEDLLRVDSLKKVDLPLQSYDSNLLNQLANTCLTRRLNLVIALNDYEIITGMAAELIALLKKEYHLK